MKLEAAKMTIKSFKIGFKQRGYSYMKLTLLHHTPEGMNRYPLSGWRIRGLMFIALIVLPLLACYATYQYVSSQSVEISYTQAALQSMREQLDATEIALEETRKNAQMQLDEITRKAGIMQSDVMRINAVGKRLLAIAGIETTEFDFDSTPALGGPENPDNIESVRPISKDNLDQYMQKMSSTLEIKRQQIAILESVLLNREIDIASYISGRPVKKGWNSSQYGKRIDPFSGNPAWHEGMDFAGKEDDEIITTAAGVVSFVGEKWGYGLTVEVNHGNGIKTRYGHNKQIVVKPGQVLSKGQTISKMGSSGRSTGPHVHYEVLLNNKPVDPKKYVLRRGKKS